MKKKLKRKIEIVDKRRLNSIELIISKEIQEPNISEKGYLFIKEEVNR